MRALKTRRATDNDSRPGTIADAQSLLAHQSFRRALIAAAVAAAVLVGLWVWLADLTGRFFPWFSIIQGFVIGRVVRRYGRGIDFRFPALAGAVTLIAAFAGHFAVAVATTQMELQAGALEVLRGITVQTWAIYFDEVVNVVDFIYAFAAVILAMFYSRPHLQREQVLALRKSDQKAQ